MSEMEEGIGHSDSGVLEVGNDNGTWLHVIQLLDVRTFWSHSRQFY